MKLISVVVPCYNEQEVLPLFYNEINKVIAQMQSEYDDLEFELLFINDGSKAVSYTHLDVYKRQQVTIPIIAFFVSYHKIM